MEPPPYRGGGVEFQRILEAVLSGAIGLTGLM